MVNKACMKKRFSKLSALLVLGLLLIGMSLACYMWVRREQLQYTLNRQLIAALLKNDMKQARVLVEAGADPNTREEPAPAPTLSLLMQKLLHPSPPTTNTGSTAFLLACRVKIIAVKGSNPAGSYFFHPPDPQLTQTMLLHGANVHAKDREGTTALHTVVVCTYIGASLSDNMNTYNTNKEVISQLLAYGADPDEEGKAYRGMFGKTPMKSALGAVSLKANAHPDLVALLRKYRKHP